jgi:subtilase family protein
MTENTRRFLLGKGENLAEEKAYPRRRLKKDPVYGLDVAKQSFAAGLAQAVEYFEDLPDKACPENEVTAMMVLHPTYIAKSYWPLHLIDDDHLRSVGSKPTRLVPRKVRKTVDRVSKTVDGEEEVETVALFVAGDRDTFRGMLDALPGVQADQPQAKDLIKVESFLPMTPQLRLKPIPVDDPEPLLEVVLHADYQYILDGFAEYLKSIGVNWRKACYPVEGLCFCPVRAPEERIGAIADYSFVRAIRGMPKLRSLRPISVPVRSGGASFRCQLPDADALNQDVKAAVFDGGLPPQPDLSRWVKHHVAKGLGKPHPQFLEHGLAVTSSVLFGPLGNGGPLDRPPGRVDHYRVLDANTGKSDPDLYEVLSEIEAVLRTGNYEFVNLSIGPDIPVDDDDVHVWGVVLDKYLSTGQTLATIAVGNNGEQDRASGLARVLVPSDSVHAMAVGACDSLGPSWSRAPYSCVGPGRCPGMVKPEVVHFGGTSSDPFYALGVGAARAVGVNGTSFASPYVLRTAMAVRAQMGSQMSALALKALLINRAETNGSDLCEVGWGRIPADLNTLLLCDGCEARVVFQGRLRPGGYVQVPIPFPRGDVKGMVEIAATFCFACPTDPQDAANYTRSGLEITFRPRSTDFRKPADQYPKSAAFFSQGDFEGELERRRNAHKWETTLHAVRNKRSTSLDNPAFYIHHGARAKGRSTAGGEEIPYALVLNVRADKDNTLYDRIVTQYRTQLEVMRPVIRIPIRPQS